MQTKNFFSLLALCLGLMLGTSNVMAECFDQPLFNVKGYCRADNNDGYYIKGGVGIPITRAGFQCKFIQISSADLNKIIFIPYAPGSTGDDEFTSLLNAVANSASISAFVSAADCTAICDSNNNLVVTVGSNVFTYPCGDYAECVNDASGGHCTGLTCANVTLASPGFYQNGSDPTPLIWCPHLPLTRDDKTNGLDVPTTTYQACPLTPTPSIPCYFSTCGNGQLNTGEDCDTLIDTTGRCVGCDCGNFVNGVGGMCSTSCILTPTCTGETPFLVNCGCSMCPSTEQLMWPEKIQCKLTSTKSMVYGISATSTTTFYELPRTCKSCGTAESNGTYTPRIKVRTHGFYRNNYSSNIPYDRDYSSNCTDFATGSPKNMFCVKEVSSGSVLNLVDNQGVDCPVGTYNDTSINETKRAILSCNLCSGLINQYYTGIIGGVLGKPYYYDGTCHACEKGRAPTYYGNTSWFYCAQYGVADLNNDGDVTDPGENLTYNLAASDPDAPLYNRNSACDNSPTPNRDGLLDSGKAFHRWYTSNTCVPYNFCTDTAITDGSIYLRCPQITDPTTLAALQALKPACPAEKQTLVTTPTEYVNTVCTPCPDGYNHISTYLTLMQSNGTTLNFDYRTHYTSTNPSVNAGKFTCHTTCTSAAPYYYDDGTGLTCHSCPQGYTQIQNTWSSSYNSQYIQCSQITCPLMSLIYSDGGGAPPTCHACPQNTFQLTNTTNWPLAGSHCWPAIAYCNNTKYPTTNNKYATGIFYRHVTQSTTYYDATSGALTKRDDSTNISPPFYTDNSIYSTDPAICSCPAGTRYEDHAYNGTSVPDYSYFYNADVNLYRPTVYCVDCPAGSDYFYQGAGDASPVCHTCSKTTYYQAAGESSPSCHACTSSYFYQGTGDPAPTCHVCPQSQPICPAAFNCSLPQYSCNIYGDPDFDPDAWDHMPNCDCRCKLTAASCTGSTPYLNPVLCKCQSTSLTAYCGNGVMDPGEECDTMEDGDSYEDSNGVPHINRCIACKIHRVTACDGRAYISWVNGAYTERPVAGQCPAALTPATNNAAGLSAYTCAFWEPKHIDTALDPNPVHQSEATDTSGCIFTCQTGFTYDPVTKTCGM